MVEKPITLVIDETRLKIVDALNNSKLPFFIMDSIIKEIFNEVHQIATIEAMQYKEAYEKSLEETAEK